MKDEAPSFMERMQKSMFGGNRSSKKGKNVEKGRSSTKAKKGPRKPMENCGADSGKQKTKTPKFKTTKFKTKPASLKSTAASLKSRAASIKSLATSIKSTIRQKLADAKAKIIKKPDVETSDDSSQDSRPRDGDHGGEYEMSGALDSETEGDREEYESEDDMVREVDPERRKEQRRRRRRQARRIRRRRRRERRAKRRGTSESESSEDSAYYP
ncbi:hypothetical protein VE03_04295 [Pseudogymnoascus sp. 23342-1-I1]|nr:hypothetical protein VE03_04295 [Pseudogymnoascus sp. 23342-1-I1]